MREIGNETPDFIVYLNDNNKAVEAFVKVLKITDGYATFKTGSNILTIPFSRIYKIKQKEALV